MFNVILVYWERISYEDTESIARTTSSSTSLLSLWFCLAERQTWG